MIHSATRSLAAFDYRRVDGTWNKVCGDDEFKRHLLHCCYGMMFLKRIASFALIWQYFSYVWGRIVVACFARSVLCIGVVLLLACPLA